MFPRPYHELMSTATRTSDMVSRLITLGYELDAHGFAGREAAVRQVVRDTRSLGLDCTAVGVLADTSAPDVARMRAFAAVSAALAAAQMPVHRDPHGDRHLVGAA